MKKIKYIVIAFLFSSAVYSCGVSGNIRISSYFKKTGTDAWENIGGSALRNNCRALELRPPLKLAWKNTLSSAPNEALVISSNILYTGTLDGRIYAISIEKGQVIGNLKFLYAATNGLCVRHQTGIFALASGKEALICYDLYDNKFKYIKQIRGIETNPLVIDDYIYLADQFNQFYSLNYVDGVTLWSFETPKPVRSSASVSGTSVFFGCDDGKIYSLNRYNGRVNWTFQTGQSVYAASALDETALYVGSTDSTFYAIDLKEGKLLWKYRIGTAEPGKFFTGAAVHADKVIVGATDGCLYAFDKMRGNLLWKFRTNAAISASPVIAGKIAYVGSQDTYLYAVDLDSGVSVWNFKAEGRIKTNPALYGDYLFVASEPKNVYAFKVETKP
jgi:outer membrane protein assembly factor BamB